MMGDIELLDILKNHLSEKNEVLPAFLRSGIEFYLLTLSEKYEKPVIPDIPDKPTISEKPKTHIKTRKIRTPGVTKTRKVYQTK